MKRLLFVAYLVLCACQHHRPQARPQAQWVNTAEGHRTLPPQCVVTTNIPTLQDDARLQEACGAEGSKVSVTITGDSETVSYQIVYPPETLVINQRATEYYVSQGAEVEEIMQAIFPSKVFVFSILDGQKRPVCMFRFADNVEGQCRQLASETK
jgi:hypothetical protein